MTVPADGPGATIAPDPATATIESLEAARLRAMQNGDVATLRDLLSDDVVYVHSIGVVDDKSAFLANIEGRRVDYASVTFTTDEVRVTGSTGLAIGTMTVPIPDPANPTTSITVAVWAADREGSWQLVSYQGTRRRSRPSR